MVNGKFVGNIPYVRVALAGERLVLSPVTILDTGFTGDLQVTPKIARELRLRVSSVASAQIASGRTVHIPVARATAAMEGEVRNVQVFISNSMPLIGISFLTKFGYRACVDCKYRTVVLERVV